MNAGDAFRWRRPGLRRSLRRALRMLPVDGDMMGLLSNLSEARRRPIRLLTHEGNPTHPTGLWVGKPGCDYIIVDAAASPASRTMIIAHEVSHMLLRHTNDATAEIPEELLTSVAPRMDPAVAVRVLARHGYGRAVEVEAEEMGTALAAEARRRQRIDHFHADPVSARLR